MSISHVLVGPNQNIEEIKQIYSMHSNYKIHGGGGQYIIDCKNLKLPANANVIIHAHGLNENNNHLMELCSTNDYTGSAFKEISSGTAKHIELLSCFGGAAINEINSLPIGSTLITFISENYSSASEIEKQVQKVTLGLKYTNNPFIKFASYIFISPDDTKFAISTKDNQNNIFSTKIKTLTDSIESIQGIKLWQNMQLERFISFCKKIKLSLDKKAHTQVEALLNIYDDQVKFQKWHNQFNSTKYSESLLMNMININQLDAVKKLFQIGVDINNNAIDFSPLHLSAQNGNDNLTDLLLANGADVANRKSDQSTPLHTAASNGHLSTVVKLVEAGSDINAKDKNENTPLLWAIKKNDQVSIKLIELGADVNLMSKKVAVLHYVFFYSENKELLVKTLAAGADTSLEVEDGKTILDYAAFSKKTKKFAKEVKLYNKSPIEYILKHHTKAESAARSLEKIKLHKQFSKFHEEVHKTVECLIEQANNEIIDLNQLCGQDGAFFHQDSDL